MIKNYENFCVFVEKNLYILYTILDFLGGYMEKTYIMVKPHFANYDKVIELVKSEARKAGMTIVKEKFVKYTKKDAQAHYAEHFRGSYENAKGFYKELEDYITSDKAYGMVMVGEDAIKTMRAIIKQLRVAVPAMLQEQPRMTENVLHGSDCIESAEREIAIFEQLPNYCELSK